MITEIILVTIAVYLILGLVFAIAFLAKGIEQTDEGARGSSIGFRIIIVPGVIVFWVLLLKKWLRANKENSHD